MKYGTIHITIQWCGMDNYVIHKISTYLGDVHREESEVWLLVAILGTAQTCRKNSNLQATLRYRLYGWFTSCRAISSSSFEVLASMEALSVELLLLQLLEDKWDTFNSLKCKLLQQCWNKDSWEPFPTLYPKPSIEGMHSEIPPKLNNPWDQISQSLNDQGRTLTQNFGRVKTWSRYLGMGYEKLTIHFQQPSH